MSREEMGREGFVVNIEAYEHPTALVEFGDDGRQNEILLVIDWAGRTISVVTREQFDYADEAWLRDRVDIYDLPPNVDATELRDWIEREVVPRAQPLAEAFEIVSRNGKQWGEFPGMEAERRGFHVWMSIHADPPQHDLEIWGVREWVDLGELIDLGLTPDIPDEELETLADNLLSIAAFHQVVLVGGKEAVVEYLRELRDTLGEIPLWGGRPTTPREPDCYKIRGYEVLEGTVKPHGNSAHVTVPRKHLGKRVKVVILEP